MYYLVPKITSTAIETFVNCGNSRLCNEFSERIILLVCTRVNLIKGFITYSYAAFDTPVTDKKRANTLNLIEYLTFDFRKIIIWGHFAGAPALNIALSSHGNFANIKGKNGPYPRRITSYLWDRLKLSTPRSILIC